MSAKGYIPREILEFFNTPKGRSLLVKGLSGTGKTMFSLELIEEISEIENTFYISTRVGDEALYSQFKWLKEKEWRDRLIDVSRGFLKAVTAPAKPVKPTPDRERKIRGAREILSRLKEGATPIMGKLDRTYLNNLLSRVECIELESLYDRIEIRLPKKSLAVIDSINALSERYGVSMEEIIKTLQLDLVESSNINLVFVLEKSETDTTIDYLVDGLVTMREEKLHGRRIRRMELNKLRATRVSYPSYIFTLYDARFHCFEPFTPKLHLFSETDTHDGIQDGKGTEYDAKGRFSTGNKELDSIIGFGYPRGSFVLVELDDGTPPTAVPYIIGPTIENFLTHGRGVVDIVAEGFASENIVQMYSTLVGSEKTKRCVRVIDKKLESDRGSKPWLVEMDTNDFDGFIGAWKHAISDLNEKSPLLVAFNWDAIEGFLPEDDVFRLASYVVSGVKSMNELVIGVAKPGVKVAQKLRNMADFHLRLASSHGCLLLWSEKPRTGMYDVDLDDKMKHPHLKLMPMV